MYKVSVRQISLAFILCMFCGFILLEDILGQEYKSLYRILADMGLVREAEP